MRIHHLYTDDKGETHFKDIEIEWGEWRRSSRVAAPIPVTRLYFRETGADQDVDWHTAPRRQYLVNLDCGVQLTASDGEVRYVGPGEIILLDDTTGKGHISKAVDGKIRHSLFIALDPPEADVRRG